MTSSTSKNDDLYKKLLDVYDDDDVEVANGGDIIVIHHSEPGRRAGEKNRRSWSSSCGGCLCKCVMISFLVLSLLFLMASVATYLWMKDVVQHLTVYESETFPVVDMSDAELDLLQSRVEVFLDELLTGREPPEDLVITQDEINGLLCHSDYLRGNIFVTLTENKIYEEYSLPMDMFPGGRRRFFLGHDDTRIDTSNSRIQMQMETAAKHEDWFVGPLYSLGLHYENSDSSEYHQRLLELFVENGSIFGNDIPQDYIDQHVNLLEGAYADPDDGPNFRAVVDGIEAVAVQDGRIVVTPRRRSTSSPSSSSSSASTSSSSAYVTEEGRDPAPAVFVRYDDDLTAEPTYVEYDEEEEEGAEEEFEEEAVLDDLVWEAEPQDQPDTVEGFEEGQVLDGYVWEAEPKDQLDTVEPVQPESTVQVNEEPSSYLFRPSEVPPASPEHVATINLRSTIKESP